MCVRVFLRVRVCACVSDLNLCTAAIAYDMLEQLILKNLVRKCSRKVNLPKPYTQTLNPKL